MKTFFCVSVCLIGLLASVATASAADEKVVRITTSRSLRVACVHDSSDDAPWRIMQQAFVTSMSTCLTVKGDAAMPVKIHPANASRAASELINGKCDAVLFLGEKLPSNLQGDKFTSMRVVSQIGSPVRVFYFVQLDRDPVMQAALAAAFEAATSSDAFQDTVSHASAVRAVASKGDR